MSTLSFSRPGPRVLGLPFWSIGLLFLAASLWVRTPPVLEVTYLLQVVLVVGGVGLFAASILGAASPGTVFHEASHTIRTSRWTVDAEMVVAVRTEERGEGWATCLTLSSGAVRWLPGTGWKREELTERCTRAAVAKIREWRAAGWEPLDLEAVKQKGKGRWLRAEEVAAHDAAVRASRVAEREWEGVTPVRRRALPAWDAAQGGAAGQHP